ncbi:MAG: hypothetical protein ACYC6X_03500 [Minisyncoccota bacterium]
MTILGALMGFLLFSGGTTAAPTQVATSTPPSYAVTLTAYNAVPAQTDSDPLETASGAYSNPEVVAARSRNLADKLPFGTIIELDGSNISSENTCGYSVVAPRIGYRVIADTMNAHYTDRIDVLFDTKADYATAGGVKNAANVLGVCKGVTVRVVGHVAINRIPTTQVALAAIVANDDSALAFK